MQLAYQVFRRNEAELSGGDAIEEITGLLGALVSVAPELFEVTAEVDEVVTDGGEFAKVAWLELIDREEASELVWPELARVEQVIEGSRLEVIADEEVAKIAFEFVWPECIYKCVWREISRVEEIVEVSIREVLGVAGSRTKVSASGTIKGLIAVKYEVSSLVEGECSCETRVRCGSKGLAVRRGSTVGIVTGIEIAGIKVSSLKITGFAVL